MALVHSNKGELPDARALLYENVIDILLWRWDAVKIPRGGEEIDIRMLMKQAEIQDVDLKRALWELAYKVHAQVQESDDGEATSDIPESLLIETLRTLAPDGGQTWTEAMLEIINLRAGLLVERRPGVYSFPHRTFQEYLAGCHLATLPDFTDVVVKISREGAFWWQVILLAVGKLVHVNGDVDKPLVLVSELCPEQEPTMGDADGWRGCWLAGKALIEIGVKRAQRRDLGRDMTERLQERLTALVDQGLLEPRERADAGSVLSVLGDPRDFNEMVDVPAGEFLMGSSDGVRRAEDREKPQHSLFVDVFRISKHPVTNAQYAEFVKATGHEPPKHWRGQEPPPDLRNHPVVYVTWRDAVAYCDWLQKKTGLPFRLPTEAEWEKAARGTDGRIYPWRDDFSTEKCNVYETGIRNTSPVGMFPDGASPYRCLDMSGNVWEWTLSKYKPYPYKSDDGREDMDKPVDGRVLRGGSFLDPQQDARCACRLSYHPRYRDYDLGFRVVVPGS
jgi:formylglycine-generating enzyme required for sulfatase activity